jgi:hypothetical protein
MPRQSNFAAILIMLLAVGAFALMDAMLKLLAPHYPALEVAALRGAASLPFVLVWALATVGPRELLRIRWPLHLLRGVLAVSMMGTFIYALARMPRRAAQRGHFQRRVMPSMAGSPFRRARGVQPARSPDRPTPPRAISARWRSGSGRPARTPP